MLKPISLQKLGLLGMSSFDEGDIKAAKRQLIKKLDFVSMVFNEREFDGYIQEKNKSYKNRVLIELDGKSIGSFNTKWLEERIYNIKDTVSLLKVIELLSTVFPPLYIGIAIDQTLSSRYDQHWNNYNNGKKGCFSSRLIESGIDWSDVSYMAVKIPTELVNEEMIGFCEDLIHGLTKPIFSYY